MGKKRKLRKLMRDRGCEDAPALVICVGQKCARREVSRAVAEDVRAYAIAHHPSVRVETVGCLNVCKKGPVSATYPRIKFHKRVDARRGRRLIDKLARRSST